MLDRYCCEPECETGNCCMDWLKRKIVNPLVRVLKSGLTAEKLALSFTLGIFGGLFPIPGTTTLVCFVLIYLFDLNPVATQVVNLAVTPWELLLMFPFMKAGNWMFGGNLQLTPDMIYSKLQSDFFGFLSEFFTTLIYGIIVWLLSGIFCSMIAYRIIILPLTRFTMARLQTNQPLAHRELLPEIKSE